MTKDELREKANDLPLQPGVYLMMDKTGKVIYVGKAKNLRQRLSNYFQDLAALHPRTQKMVTTACAVEWTVVSTEVESLALEYSWIKEFNPRFNVMYKDDKSYPYLAVTMGETYPRVQVVRGARKPGTRYFGPFVQAWSIRETVEQLLRVFPVRSCSAGFFEDSADVLHALFSLFDDTAGNDLAFFRVDGNLTGCEEEIAGFNSLGIRAYCARSFSRADNINCHEYASP